MKASQTSHDNFNTQQDALAFQAMFTMFEGRSLSKDQTSKLAVATSDALSAYEGMLLTGNINARTVTLLAHQLSDTYASCGFTHEQFMGIARSFMGLGYHAGFFAVYIDYSLAAERGDLEQPPQTGA